MLLAGLGVLSGESIGTPGARPPDVSAGGDPGHRRRYLTVEPKLRQLSFALVFITVLQSIATDREDGELALVGA